MTSCRTSNRTKDLRLLAKKAEIEGYLERMSLTDFRKLFVAENMIDDGAWIASDRARKPSEGSTLSLHVKSYMACYPSYSHLTRARRHSFGEVRKEFLEYTDTQMFFTQIYYAAWGLVSRDFTAYFQVTFERSWNYFLALFICLMTSRSSPASMSFHNRPRQNRWTWPKSHSPSSLVDIIVCKDSCRIFESVAASLSALLSVSSCSNEWSSRSIGVLELNRNFATDSRAFKSFFQYVNLIFFLL